MEQAMIADAFRTSCILSPNTANKERIDKVRNRLEHITDMLKKMPPQLDGEQQLMIITPDGVPSRWIVLKDDDISIGRELDTDIQLLDSEISRLHCILNKRDGDWQIIDKGSANGVFVNGHPVTAYFLSDGDLISVGKHELLFADQGVEEVNL
jgi:pSer/pThr/pTyr-binding forkhead associated (FHA) protein